MNVILTTQIFSLQRNFRESFKSSQERLKLACKLVKCGGQAKVLAWRGVACRFVI